MTETNKMSDPLFIDHSLYVKGLIEIKLAPIPNSIGFKINLFRNNLYKKSKLFGDTSWNEDYIEYLHKDMLDGISGDSQNYRLFHVNTGSIQLFAIDKRKTSSTFNKTLEFILDNNTQILIPPKVLVGYLCLSENSIITYKLSYGYTKPQNQSHIHWKNNGLNLPWQTTNPILSKRDE